MTKYQLFEPVNMITTVLKPQRHVELYESSSVAFMAPDMKRKHATGFPQSCQLQPPPKDKQRVVQGSTLHTFMSFVLDAGIAMCESLGCISLRMRQKNDFSLHRPCSSLSAVGLFVKNE